MAQIPDETPAQSIEKLARQAQDLLEAGLFAEAASHYQDALKLIEKGTFIPIESELHLKLAQALFQLKDYKSAIEQLQGHASSPYHQFLLAGTYRNNGEYDQAIKTLQSYLNKTENKEIHWEEARYELALAFFLKGDLTHAQEIFESLHTNAQNHRLQILSNFYLAKINMTLGLLNKAEFYLNEADHLLTDDDLLKYESAFLRGEIFYKNLNFEKAAKYFEKAIPQQSCIHSKWYEETLYYLGTSYLKIADTLTESAEKQEEFFKKSEQMLTKLTQLKPQDRSWLALGECLLIKGKCLKDENILKRAEEIFSDTSKYSSSEFQNQATLLKAQSHPVYLERDKRFRQLTQQSHVSDPTYAQAWYLRGINDFEEGCSLLQYQKNDEAHKIFERSSMAFERAEEISQDTHPEAQAQARIFQARAYYSLATDKSRHLALNALDPLWENNAKLLHFLPDPLEAYTLYGLIAIQLPAEEQKNVIMKMLEGLALFSKSSTRPSALNTLATLFYKAGNFSAAEETFQQLSQENSLSPLAAEALFQASKCAEKQQKDNSCIRAYRQKIIEEYPSSTIAPEAYFSLFSYQEYLQGDRAAIRHLNTFPELYPESPFVLNALFLMGLDNKRNRRSPEGKWLKKKNLTAAIDNFQDVETYFERLYSKEKIPTSHMEHYLLIRYRAHLEKGIANYTLGIESSGAKKQIYLEYAQETLLPLLEELQSGTYKNWTMSTDPFWHLEEENAHWLSLTYIAMQQHAEAEKLLSSRLEKYKSNGITRGYFLSRTWSTQGTLALDRQEYAAALEYFLNAEDAAKGKVLSSDQRLEILIQQSLCLKQLNQLEKAVLILSKVVNDDAVSSLRVKAMFLRAEIYEKQERFELARKQLESTSKKGGEWALKAKEKLEKEYGYR